MVFRALVTDRNAEGVVASLVEHLDEARLPDGEVLVGIEWGGLNYKDALCLTGRGNLVKAYPHVCGIDFAGRVIESRDRRYHPGQSVILTGWRVGELTWGGYATRARVKADWLVPLPQKFSTRDTMILGTAGLTAMLALNRILRGSVEIDKGEALVTGASGGVGSIAAMLLARLGFSVTAVTGRPAGREALEKLGVTEIISREDFLKPSGKVLDKERYTLAIDAVGGPVLGEALKKIRYGGAVASIGAAGGADWDASVIPFILRGITLYGIDSVMAPFAERVAAWDRLSSLYVPGAYARMVEEKRLEDLPALAESMLRGEVAGRVIVNPRLD